MSRVWFFSGISPWSGQWEYRHGGAGTGEGEPPSPGKMSPDSSSPPALRAPPPPPPGGEGSHGDTRGKPCPGSGVEAGFPKDREKSARNWFFPGISSCTGPWWLSPWGGADGEGARPLPGLCLVSSLQRPDSIPTDCHPPVTPSPPAGNPYVPPQNPRLRGGAVRGDTGDKPSPRMQPPG